MSLRDAIKILMQSPVYFRLDLKARQDLLREFLSRHGNPPIDLDDHPNKEIRPFLEK